MDNSARKNKKSPSYDLIESNPIKDINYFLDIDYHWNNIKIWWDNVKITDNLFPKEIKKVSENDKNIFNIKFLYLIKTIFNINDINNINSDNKININDYDFNELYSKISSNYKLFNMFIEDDVELKNIINYILQFKNYFGLIKKKIYEIIYPLFNDENFDKLFRCDDDLTRIMAPIAGSIFYIYITERDIEKTLQISLELDNVYIQFFIVSYLIIDNFMDTIDGNAENAKNKKIFLKWFMNIVENPGNKVILNEEHYKIWQCCTFEKYFSRFTNKYPVNENKIIYDYVKVMIKILNVANTVQKNSNSNENDIVEHTFKKSYAVSFFMALLIDIKKFKQELIDTGLGMKETSSPKDKLKKNMKHLCKLIFLIQIYDDYFDIDKDIAENNYTYFNSAKVNMLNDSYRSPELNNIDFDRKIKKTIISAFLFIKELNEKNNNITNIINYSIKYILLIVFYMHTNKIDRSLVEYFFEYTFFSENSIQYFNKDSYDQYNSDIILKFIKQKIVDFL